MANPTTNYGFVMPTSTDLVTDLPADFDVFGQAVDTQMLTNANAAIAKAIVDAKGDIIAATAADTVSLLAVGANDTVLTADSAEATGLKWAAPAAGGYTLISSGSLIGASVSITSIPATYYRLAIFCNDFYPSVDDSLAISVNSTTGIYATTVGRDSSAVTDTNLEFVLPENQNNAAVDSAAVMYIDNYANTTSFKTTFQNIFTRKADDTNFLIGGASGMIRTTSAISSIQIKYQAGATHSAGTYEIYGVK
uniref:hypothetical protein n=1 Tax=Yoonia sp. TaxID=2212373 RepID=UPI004047E091